MAGLILFGKFLLIFVFIALVGIIYFKASNKKFTALTIHIFTMFGAIVGATTAELIFAMLGESFSFTHNYLSYLVGILIICVTFSASFFTLRWNIK